MGHGRVGRNHRKKIKTHLKWNLVGEVGFHSPSPTNKIGALVHVGSFRPLG